ncbi:aminotransferase class I/II-fold pyridoxal phosphate-dependent enzyme [Bradyrhizobium sp. 131]|uniref:aminotransferase class I/II-fold pyridoxal phosphate-dependent enzyme n=1 Tax=Bradyrhizobium sp. 131 TaxID=2782609 RepID=UPI001FFEC7CF|nr:aminotransferase class I/II-fold pyridoxal phosphate-dependent enzyme [Bradyrhizobium sp. 131]
MRGREASGGDDRLNDHRQVVDFARCSYLGLHSHPLVVAGAIEAIEAHRSREAGCTRTSVFFDLLEELKTTLSKMFSARVVAFPSGTPATVRAMPVLASGQLTGGRRPVVVFDRLTRIALGYDKTVSTHETRVEMIEHNDIYALERLCRENPMIAYVCDGAYSTGGCSPIKELRQLQERYGLFLLIDDAHGLSILGCQGEGFARSQFPECLDERTVITSSLAKGFGASGELLMLGSAEHEALFRRCYISDAISTAPNLAAVGAALGSCKVQSTELSERQSRLAQKIDIFDRHLATAEQGNPFPIRLITVGSEANARAIARDLLDCGFHVLARAVPTAGQRNARIRLCITAEHETKDVEQLCESILENVVKTNGKPYPLR